MLPISKFLLQTYMLFMKLRQGLLSVCQVLLKFVNESQASLIILFNGSQTILGLGGPKRAAVARTGLPEAGRSSAGTEEI